MSDSDSENVVPFRRPAPVGPPPPEIELSDTVVFNQDGAWIRPAREEDKLYVFPDGQLPVRWRNSVEIAPGTPLRVVLNFLRGMSARDRALADALTFSNLQPFLDEAEKPLVGDDDPTKGLRAIVVTHYTSYMKFGKKKRLRLSQSVDISGVAADSQDNYAVDFLPVNALANLPMYQARQGLFYSTESDIMEPYAFDLSLGEFLEALLDEICFHGTPSSRDEKMGELKEAVEELDSGEVTTRSWEEVKRELGIEDEDDE